MKQSDAAWFSRPSTPFSARRPSLPVWELLWGESGHSLRRGINSGPSLSQTALSSEFYRAPLFYPGFNTAMKPAEVSSYSGLMEPSFLSIWPLHFIVFTAILSLFHLFNMWKVFLSLKEEFMCWILKGALKQKASSPLSCNVVKVSFQILKSPFSTTHYCFIFLQGLEPVGQIFDQSSFLILS